MITYTKILQYLENYNIKDKKIQAHFLGQCYCESNGFRNVVELENYTYDRACAIWPSRVNTFSNLKNDNKFLPQPALFNLVYGNRMGNDCKEDGYKYLGRGLIQITGKDNYNRFMMWINKQKKYGEYNLENICQFVESDEGAILSAIWFWNTNNISIGALKDDYSVVTKLVTGGTRPEEIEKRKDLTLSYKILLNK